MKDSKKIENYFLMLMNGGEIPDDGKYSEAAYNICQDVKELFRGLDHTKFYKPRVKRAVYSVKTEPKTDAITICDYKEYKFSIKLDSDAYIVSCNSQLDFITQLIDIHSGREILSSDMISDLEIAASYIVKVPNYFSYDKNYQKNNDIEGFLKEKFAERAKKYVSIEKVEKCVEHIKNCYANPDTKNKYIEYLHVAESFVQKTMKKLFTEYPDYSKKVLFEFMTGYLKFDGDLCSCNYLISNDGLFELSNYNCEYVNHIYNRLVVCKNIGRLQNVPRKNIKKRDLIGDDFQLISDSFVIADLTFKI